MPARSNYRDQYKSLGWCAALGGVQSNGAEASAVRAATRLAKAQARLARMDAIVQHYADVSKMVVTR